MSGKLITSHIALAASLLFTSNAMAQVQQDDMSEDMQEAPETAVTPIVVTGTRIQRDGYSAPTPLTVLSVQDIDALSLIHI